MLPKARRLRKRSEFRTLNRSGVQRAGKLLAIQVLTKKTGPTRLGLTVSKKFGNACTRNRFKRLVREAFRLSYAHLPPHTDINIRPRSAASAATLSSIQEELNSVLCD